MLFAVLLAASFFKDEITPEYYNTPAASFLKAHPNRFASIPQHPGFWLLAAAYSLLFAIIPPLVIKMYFGQRQLTLITALLTCGLCLLLYILVFVNHPVVDRAVVVKINRYFHSPIILMFLVAAFSLNQRK
jgi:uncharacterized membrane protein